MKKRLMEEAVEKRVHLMLGYGMAGPWLHWTHDFVTIISRAVKPAVALIVFRKSGVVSKERCIQDFGGETSGKATTSETQA
jgi:hypothetical protein